MSRPFELGLVMAGAVSAGAYTAGVMDFLFQALDEWEKAKAANDPACPKHEVRLRVMAGASAGGILSAMGGVVADDQFDPVAGMTSGPSDPVGIQNKLFNAWVNQVDIVPMLQDRDLRADPIIRSLLDSTILDSIGDGIFRGDQRRAARRAYLVDPLKVIVTLTNLRGIPYRTEFIGETTAPDQVVNLGMSLHADWREFEVMTAASAAATSLPVGNLLDPRWAALKQAALATAAFPIGLKPRVISRPALEYDRRKWPVCRAHEVSGKVECGDEVTLRPMWELLPDNPVEFLAVDGGTMDNEPTERARSVLLPGRSSPETRPENSFAALVLIDPFPDVPVFDEHDTFHKDYTLVRVGLRILRSLINQARFKPGELLRARDRNVYDQYLIAPERLLPDGTRAKYDLACGALSGFSGFFSRKYREHDFQLGRLNCQNFLKRHFTLPMQGSTGETVPLFREASTHAIETYSVRDAGETRLPIIPLLGTARQAVIPPVYPSLTEDEFEAFRPLIRNRVQAVLQRYIDNIEGGLKGWLTRRLLSNALWFKRGEMVDFLMERTGTELRTWGLVT